jgi:hypothetical protein
VFPGVESWPVGGAVSGAVGGAVSSALCHSAAVGQDLAPALWAGSC